MKSYSLLLLTILGLQSFVAASQNQYADANTLIDVWLEAQKDYEQMPAIMGMVVHDQRIVWQGAFGQANVDKGLLNTTDTLSSICSTSKVFTATAIMKLVDEGKLDLDARVEDILPKYAITQAFPQGGDVTVRSMLTHTSGLPRDTLHSYWSGPDHPFPSEHELYASLATQQTEFAAGENVLYSNIGYALLGQVVEQVSGQSYKDYMASHIFEPLEMTNSEVELNASLYGNQHAIGYTAKSRQGERNIATFYQTRAMQSAAGISMSINDLAKFAMWQFRLADASEPELMHAATLNSMYATQATSANGRTNRGFGYEVYDDKQGNRWAMHGGMCPGYVSFLKMDVTSKKAYAILVNANRVRALAYVNGLIEIMGRIEPETQSQSAKKDLSDFTGLYNLSPWNSEYYVGSWGDGLMLMYLPAESLKYALYYYRHVEGDTFELVENGEPNAKERLRFIRDDQGKVVKVQNGGNIHNKMK